MNGFPPAWDALNVVLAHDWLTGMRGGERVLEVLCRAFPRAPLFTLFHNPGAVSAAINAHPIRTSWLQRIPGILTVYRYALPLFPHAVGRLRPPAADLIISTSHCVAKGIRPAVGARHLCYCFTPMRYAWTFRDEYFGRASPARLLASPMLAWLRHWDRAASANVHRFVAISRHVRARIRNYYGRDADVVYPPVDVQRLAPAPGAPRADYDLIVSALVPYKRVDLAVRAYTRLGWPLRVVGVGTERAALRAIAGSNVQLLGWQSDERVADLYRDCRLLVFPGEEDFGLVPLEAQACGRPVVAYARGGAVETVIDGRTGVLFPEQTEESLLAAVERCAAATWDPSVIRANAERFGPEQFVSGLAASIAACLQGRNDAPGVTLRTG